MLFSNKYQVCNRRYGLELLHRKREEAKDGILGNLSTSICEVLRTLAMAIRERVLRTTSKKYAEEPALRNQRGFFICEIRPTAGSDRMGLRVLEKPLGDTRERQTDSPEPPVTAPDRRNDAPKRRSDALDR